VPLGLDRGGARLGSGGWRTCRSKYDVFRCSRAQQVRRAPLLTDITYSLFLVALLGKRLVMIVFPFLAAPPSELPRVDGKPHVQESFDSPIDRRSDYYRRSVRLQNEAHPQPEPLLTAPNVLTFLRVRRLRAVCWETSAARLHTWRGAGRIEHVCDAVVGIEARQPNETNAASCLSSQLCMEPKGRLEAMYWSDVLQHGGRGNTRQRLLFAC